MSETKAELEPINCQACGSEHMETDLTRVKLSSFNESMLVCDKCLSYTVEESFKSAADLLDEVVLIARATATNPERRLEAIKALLGD